MGLKKRHRQYGSRVYHSYPEPVVCYVRGVAITRVECLFLAICVVFVMLTYNRLFFQISSPMLLESETTTPAQGFDNRLQQTGSSWMNETGMPRLDLLMRRIKHAMSPYYKERVYCNHTYSNAKVNFYSPGCIGKCKFYETLDEAKSKCNVDFNCRAITKYGSSRYELRKSANLKPSTTKEISWVRQSCNNDTSDNRLGNNNSFWESFSRTVDRALADPSLHLSADVGATRADGSIFLTIGSYRDPQCPFTLKDAFSQADNPENIYVGIVQLNCYRGCLKFHEGPGFSFEFTSPDVDCVDDFCASEEGARHCQENRVRILRLDAIEAYGPFFTRYLASKLYRGEEIFMQTDAHMQFREGWDTTLLSMMRRTLTYPYSVISNYPPGFHGWGHKEKPVQTWRRYTGDDKENPTALCKIEFHKWDHSKHQDVKRWEMMHKGSSRPDIAKSQYDFPIGVPIPRHTCFTSGGFLSAHGSIVKNAPFDPFLPFFTWGEETYMSVLFWTAGYDIYAPSTNVVRHDYERNHVLHYWDGVGTSFRKKAIYSDMVILVLMRAQHAMHFPGFISNDRISPKSLLVRTDEYMLGRKRSVEDFWKYTGVNQTSWYMDKKTQRAPSWCTTGAEPPFFKRPSNSFVQARCGIRSQSHLRTSSENGARAKFHLPCGSRI